MRRTRLNRIFANHERNDLPRDELGVLASKRVPGARIPIVFDGKVLAAPAPAAVIDPDEDERRNAAVSNQPRRGFPDPPRLPRKGARWIEQVLSVVQIEN